MGNMLYVITISKHIFQSSANQWKFMCYNVTFDYLCSKDVVFLAFDYVGSA